MQRAVAEERGPTLNGSKSPGFSYRLVKILWITKDVNLFDEGRIRLINLTVIEMDFRGNKAAIYDARLFYG